jgi:hypothetical protein
MMHGANRVVRSGRVDKLALHLCQRECAIEFMLANDGLTSIRSRFPIVGAYISLSIKKASDTATIDTESIWI